MFRRLILCTSLVLFSISAPALAQFDKSAWGFSGSFVPKWKTPAELAILFDAVLPH